MRRQSVVRCDVRGNSSWNFGKLTVLENQKRIVSPTSHKPYRWSVDAVIRQQEGSVVLICHTDRRSSTAATALRKAGKQQALVLRGGMTAWRANQPD